MWVHLRCLHSWLGMDVPTLQASVLSEQVLALVPWENTGVITCYFTEFSLSVYWWLWILNCDDNVSMGAMILCSSWMELVVRCSNNVVLAEWFLPLSHHQPFTLGLSCTIILHEPQKILWFKASDHLPYIESTRAFIHRCWIRVISISMFYDRANGTMICFRSFKWNE
jgi:hypothetical protein